MPRTILTMLIAGLCVAAQVPNPTQRPTNVQVGEPAAIFRIEVVARTSHAVNYLHRGGSTRIDFQGSPLAPMARGSAKVESERGVIRVNADFKNFPPPSSFGPEYLTYVLWAVSPDGRPVNLGELTLDHYGEGSSSKIDTTSDIQTFGMIVTAEPYYAVTQPSDVVVMENVVRPDTRGVVEAIDARYELLPRGMYTGQGRARGFIPVLVGKKNPFELYEAENAVQLARLAGAEKYAPESFTKAAAALQQAEKYQIQQPGQKPVITMAREAAVRAEDARVVALRREQQEQLANERQASADRERASQEQAEAQRQRAEAERQNAEAAKLRSAEDARMRAQAEADRRAAEESKLAAQREREAALAQQQQSAADAERARRAEEAARKAEADARRAEADARNNAQEADRLRLKAEEDQVTLRRQILAQLNAVLETRDTARGLIVNMSDVLFDTGKYSLRPGAREKLAKVSGIVLSHPGLILAVEGHTDSVGGDEYNMRLSENRANSVRDYLVAQGINQAGITAKGFGKTMPVADNNTAAGRQANRRVELVVSGDVIGEKITSVKTTIQQ